MLLNVNALALGLGTGGYALVVALPDRLPADPSTARSTTAAAAGHVVKARYTPLQTIVLGVDEEASPHRAAMTAADDLGGLPVVVADLHSALPGDHRRRPRHRPGARVAYVMTDGGALPAWFSRTLSDLRAELAGTVTVGQAFGGDLEATNIYGGLLAAAHVLRADVAIVAQGPGNLGTGTRWGFSGTAVGEAVNAVAALGGRPVGSLRISDADARGRHHGVSHHSLTAYGRVALAARRPRGARRPARAAGGRRGRRAGTRWRSAPAGHGRRRTGSTRRCARCRSSCRRWAATSTPTTPISWPRGAAGTRHAWPRAARRRSRAAPNRRRARQMTAGLIDAN